MSDVIERARLVIDRDYLLSIGESGLGIEFTFTVPENWILIDLLIVGGGGGSRAGGESGGGGGGEVIYVPPFEVTPGDQFLALVAGTGAETRTDGHSYFGPHLARGGKVSGLESGGTTGGASGSGNAGGARRPGVGIGSGAGGGGGGDGLAGTDAFNSPNGNFGDGGSGGIGSYWGHIYGNEVGEDGWFGGGGAGNAGIGVEGFRGRGGGGGPGDGIPDILTGTRDYTGGGGWSSSANADIRKGASGLIIVRWVEIDTGILNCDPVGIDQIVYDLATRAGIPRSRIDVDQLAPASDFPDVYGFGIGRPASARTMIELLQRYAFFDVTEQGGVIEALRRDRAPDATIGGDDLRAHAYGETPPTLCERDRTEDYEIPLEVRVQYSQIGAEYESGSEAYARRVTDAAGVLDIDLTSIAMEPDRAAGIAESTMLEAIAARETLKFSLVATGSNKNLKPGDIKTLNVNGRTDVVRLVECNYAYPGIQQWQALRHDPTVYDPDAIGAGRGIPGSVIFAPGPTTFEMLDAPLVREFDDEPGYFAALGGNPTIPGVIEGWPGGALLRDEGGVQFEIGRQLRPTAIFGETVTALPDAPHTIIDWSAIEVTASAPLSTVTIQQALAGRNLAAVEVRSGVDRVGWEIIRFLSAEVDSDGNWTISGLMRGVYGTEWATGLHQAGDRFIGLDGGMQVFAEIEGELNILRTHNAATLGQEPNPETEVNFAWRGVDRIPWAPVQLSAERADNTATISWRRRDRVGMELQHEQTLPLSEAAESYVLTIFSLNGLTVVRQVTVNEPEYEYVDELADFGAQQSSLNVRVAQIGALGPGYPASRILEVGGAPAVPPALPSGDESRVTITVAGTFDSDDTLYFRLVFAEAGVGTHTRDYTATSGGKSAVADYLSDFESQVLADFPGLDTNITGNVMVISTTAGVLTGTMRNNTVDVFATLAQEAAGVSAGVNYVGTLDFYNNFGAGDVLGPSLSSQYGLAGSITARLQVVGITYDAAKAIGPGNVAQFNIGSSHDLGGEVTSNLFPLSFSVAAIQANSGFMNYATLVSLSQVTGVTFPALRAGTRIRLEPNYRLAEQFWVTEPSNVSANLAPMKYLNKTNQQAQPAFPSGAEQIILVSFIPAVDQITTPQSLVEGQIFKIRLDSTTFSRTVTAGDATDERMESILQALADDIDAEADYVVDLFTANRPPSDPLAPGTFITRIEIRHATPNTPFTFAAYASYGIEVTVVNEIVPE